MRRFVELAEQLREEGTWLCRRGLKEAAALCESVAEDLEDVLRETESEVLDLREASAQSGYSVDHLGRLVREGKIRNAGRHGAPRIARRDLPRKSGMLAISDQSAELDRTQIVRSAIKEGAG